jgi:hypothetical protein
MWTQILASNIQVTQEEENEDKKWQKGEDYEEFSLLVLLQFCKGERSL